MKTNLNSVLSVKDFELSVYLGWPDEERRTKQIIHVDIDIFFKTLPKGSVSDDLQDTFCYATFLLGYQEKIKNNVFRLLETITYDIYQALKKELRLKARVLVRVTKHPKVPGLKGGASFSCWDKKA